jgi:hypothetical protein
LKAHGSVLVLITTPERIHIQSLPTRIRKIFPYTIPELFLPNICIYLKKKSLLIASLFPDSKQNFFDNGNFSSSSKGECGNSAPSADKCQGGQSPVRLGVGQGSLHSHNHGEDGK